MNGWREYSYRPHFVGVMVMLLVMLCKCTPLYTSVSVILAKFCCCVNDVYACVGLAVRVVLMMCMMHV
jgi:hypothetical protein